MRQTHRVQLTNFVVIHKEVEHDEDFVFGVEELRAWIGKSLGECGEFAETKKEIWIQDRGVAEHGPLCALGTDVRLEQWNWRACALKMRWTNSCRRSSSAWMQVGRLLQEVRLQPLRAFE